MRCRFQAPGVRHPRPRAPRYRRAQPIQTRGRARRLRHQRLRPRPARLPAPGRPSGRRLLQLRPWPAETGRFPARTERDTKGRCAAPQRRRAVEAGRCLAPKPQLQPEIRRAPPPSAVHVARPPPAARVAPPPPPPRMAAPPPRGWPRRAATRMAAPSPPPPRMAAPPPPRRRATTAAPDGCASAAPGSAASGGSQEMPAECSEMLIVSADRTCLAGRGPKSPGNKARKLALFPCFWLESGYTPRHLTRKHGSKGRPVAAGP